jgi:SAM-dependent methyltransferase
MIEKARAKLAGLGVEVVPHSLPAPLPARDGAFDAVLFTLVADHLEDLVGGFRELRRVTRVGGEVVFTVLHPALHILGVSARFTDPTSGDEVRVAAFDHGYGDYVMGVLGSGLAIEEIVERAADQALAERAPRAAKYLGWPLLLAMRLRRVA